MCVGSSSDIDLGLITAFKTGSLLFLSCLFPDGLSVSPCLVLVPDWGCTSQLYVGSVVLTPDLTLARQGLPREVSPRLPHLTLLQLEAYFVFRICLYPRGWFCFTCFELLGGVSQNDFDMFCSVAPRDVAEL